MSDCYGPCQRGEACGQCGYQGPGKVEGLRVCRTGYPDEARELEVERDELRRRVAALRKAMKRAMQRIHLGAEREEAECATTCRTGYMICHRHRPDIPKHRCSERERCRCCIALDALTQDNKAARRKR